MSAVGLRRSPARLVIVFLLAGAACWPALAMAASPAGVRSGGERDDAAPPGVESNDNLRAAGTLEDGTLRLALRAGRGRWKPEGPSGPALEVEAFGEVGRVLTVPAPLIRVMASSRA